MEKQQLFEGVAVTIRGRDYIIPGLSFGQMEDMAETIDRMAAAEAQKKFDKQFISDSIDIVHAALSRNYPLTRDDVRDMVDTRNMKTIIEIVMNNSGLQKQPTGEAGETKPVV